MARPKGKPSQEGKPTVEFLRQTIGEERPKINYPKPPFSEFISAVMTGILSHVGTAHPYRLTREDKTIILKTAFDLAEEMMEEHKRRYGDL